MPTTAPRAILCISSYFKGNAFLERCRRDGCPIYLITLDKLRDSPWARDAVEDLFVMPSLDDRRAVVNAVAFLMRSKPIDRIVALDEFDLEMAAYLHEHFRLPGMGESAVRFFRDKLAMRHRSRESGIPIPEFVGVIRHDDVRLFLATVPGPWLLKPRTEASAIGIQKFTDADSVWRRLEELRDDQSFHLLERFIPGDLYHVDTISSAGRIVFAEVNRYQRPLLEIWQGGGVFASRTVPRESSEVAALRDLSDKLLSAFGLTEGPSHTEFLRAHADGKFYFVETSARVGGANIAEMVEAATGLNLWSEWAAVEIHGSAYQPPPLRRDYGGVIVSLARQEVPDTSGFTDPEIFYRLDLKHHIGLVVRASTPARVDELLADYAQRIARDFQAVLPPTDRPSL
jgi:biotin carboxylase